MRYVNNTYDRGEADRAQKPLPHSLSSFLPRPEYTAAPFSLARMASTWTFPTSLKTRADHLAKTQVCCSARIVFGRARARLARPPCSGKVARSAVPRSVPGQVQRPQAQTRSSGSGVAAVPRAQAQAERQQRRLAPRAQARGQNAVQAPRAQARGQNKSKDALSGPRSNKRCGNCPKTYRRTQVPR